MFYIGSRVTSSITADVCSNYDSTNCHETTLGVRCYVFTGCGEECEVLNGATDLECNQYGANCVAGRGTYCELADECSKIKPLDGASIGDLCAPNMVKKEDCFVSDLYNTGVLGCTAADATTSTTTAPAVPSTTSTTTAPAVPSTTSTTTAPAVPATTSTTTAPAIPPTTVEETSSEETTSAGQVNTSGNESTDVELSTVSGINSFAGVVSLIAATMFAF